eukprot:3661526-Alexandrium_andersonii.AAC.1
MARRSLGALTDWVLFEDDEDYPTAPHGRLVEPSVPWLTFGSLMGFQRASSECSVRVGVRATLPQARDGSPLL